MVELDYMGCRNRYFIIQMLLEVLCPLSKSLTVVKSVIFIKKKIKDIYNVYRLLPKDYLLEFFCFHYNKQ